MRSTLLTRGILGFCAVIGCLLSTSANQETTGSSFKPCDSGQQQKPEPHVTGPTEFVRVSMAEANSVTRMRRSLGGLGRVRAGGPVPLLVYTANENSNGGDVDGRPYSRPARNFMRFGRNPSTGSDDIVCLPVAASEEGPEMTSAGVDEMFAGKDGGGDEKRFSSRFRRDQAQYDYNGKPFMRFGKRYARMVGRSPEFIGSRDGDVVCFRAIVDDGREKGKRFMRFGRAFTPDPHDDQNQKEEGVTDSGEEKPVLRFGKSPFPPGMRAAADYEKQDDQSKM